MSCRPGLSWPARRAPHPRRTTAMPRHHGFLTLALLGTLGPPAQAAVPACNADLLPLLAVPHNVTLTAATAKTTSGAAYCQIDGVIAPEPSHIRFSVGLPTNWNGRFVMSGDGGFDGSVALPTNRIAQGYAGANSDSGHATPPSNDASWAYDNRM